MPVDVYKRQVSGHSFAIVCGPGNNGADGLSLAIKLFQQKKEVHVFIFDNGEHLSQANLYYLQQCYDLSIPVSLFQQDNLDEDVYKRQMLDILKF